MMSAMDPDDALDQLLNNTWSNMAQQLGMLHRSLSADAQQHRRERRAERMQQNRLQAAEIKEMELQRTRLLSWESAHRRELNNGFESVLNATILGKKGCSPLSDTSLLKAWNISDMLVGTDPGYAAQLNRARNLMNAEWSKRHPGETIEQHADRVTRNVTIAYAARTPALEDTLAAFEKAGFTVSLDRQELSPNEFEALHDGETFRVEPEFGEGWNGQRNDLIAECVMMQAVVSVDEAGQQISYLRDAGLPESSGGDNRSEGNEPSSLFEGSMNENENAALLSDLPLPSESNMEKPDKTASAMIVSSSEVGPTERRREEVVEVKTGGDLSATRIETVDDGTNLVDLYEAEEWNGPDMFGEYSPKQEASMMGSNSPMPAGNIALPDIRTLKHSDNR
ncbi:hypothetical protein LMG10733_1318 [Bifidobacterium adolescentis]|uniref:hypothetical protein n=1 Tax=Bifidobacterium adolescentis TaxID=1680 RepID=UPI000A251708|nr:hypothetical protein [Bifidobacterium adolescentis]MCT6790159.1 hypothetical protein [Bifidobacterium adolescentis]NRD15874.1 hypothetical protein [Bifidobacterium adolescentis]OSG97430.1 hypothetical protein LMG10733_1318 [Bifidobacterium adolescentis]